jgi:hypothetical protein
MNRRGFLAGLLATALAPAVPRLARPRGTSYIVFEDIPLDSWETQWAMSMRPQWIAYDFGDGVKQVIEFPIRPIGYALHDADRDDLVSITFRQPWEGFDEPLPA